MVSQVAAGLRPEVVVYGNDYDTPDGTGVRDYIHVVDLALGHLAAVKYVLENTGVEAVNLGTGQGSSVLEIVAAYSRACGASCPIGSRPAAPATLPPAMPTPKKPAFCSGWEAKPRH